LQTVNCFCQLLSANCFSPQRRRISKVYSEIILQTANCLLPNAHCFFCKLQLTYYLYFINNYMHIIPQILFLAVAAFAIWFFTKNIMQIRKNIFLGQAQDLSDNKNLRWKNVLLLALGQKKNV
jgi:hypothetical protein